MWVYGGSAGGKRTGLLFCISRQEAGCGAGGVQVEKIETGEGQGPGDVMWHAAAVLFDRFLLVYGGRRAPARAGHSKVLHAFDTVTRRWVGVDVQGGEPPPRYRHTLTRIGAVGSSCDSQLLLALGGLPCGEGGGRDRGPIVLECSLQPDAGPLDDELEQADGGQGMRSVLKVAWHSVSAHDACNRPAEPSWISTLGRREREDADGEHRAGFDGWIGHTACEEVSSEGIRVVVYGGVACSVHGLVSAGQAHTGGERGRDGSAASLFVVRLSATPRPASAEGNLPPTKGQGWALEVAHVEPGPGGPAAGGSSVFGHAACVVQAESARRQPWLLVHGGTFVCMRECLL